MEITIKADPKEIADLVLEIQGRPERFTPSHVGQGETVKTDSSGSIPTAPQETLKSNSPNPEQGNVGTRRFARIKLEPDSLISVPENRIKNL